LTSYKWTTNDGREPIILEYINRKPVLTSWY